MNKLKIAKNKYNRIIVFLIFLVFFFFSYYNCIALLISFSEGSVSMSETNKGYRAFLEYFADENGSTPLYSGVPRRQIIYAYVRKGETVYLGSSVSASRFDKNNVVKSSATGCDIYVESPSGADVSKANGFDVINKGTGFIGTRAQELAGPVIEGYNDSVNLPNYNKDCFTPLSFVAEETGVYTFYFHSTTGKRESPAKTTVESNDFVTNQKNGLVGAWDVTIFDSEEKIKHDGRVFTKYLAWSTGFNSETQESVLYSDVYVVTDDGYIYNTDFNGLDPNGFVFFASNRGLIDVGTNTPAYKSYISYYNNKYDNFVGGLEQNGLAIHSPALNDTELDKTFRIFFDAPDPELIGDFLPISYEPTPARNFKFVGTRGEGGTYIGAGGYFTFDVENATSATITIDMSHILVKNEETGEFEEKNYGIIKLSDVVSPGQTNSFFWDGYGVDENGSKIIVPTGSYNNNSIRVSLDTHSGEYHLPMIDAEGNPNGLIIERVNAIHSIRNVKVDDNGVIWCENGVKITRTTDSDGYVSYIHTPIENGKEYYESLDIPVTQMNLDVTSEYEDSRFNVYYNNLDIVDPAKRSQGVADGEDYSLTPCDSKDGAMKYSKNGNTNVVSPVASATVGKGYGNAALLDMWTFSVGERIEVKLDKEINIVEELSTIVKGNVFFDTNNNGTFSLNENDYNLSGVEVKIKYHPFKYKNVLDENGNPVYDENGDPVLEEDFDPITHKALIDLDNWEEQTTYTDTTGNYYFYNIPYSDTAGSENQCTVTVTSPNGVYSVSTEKKATNDFSGKGITGKKEQVFKLGVNGFMPNLSKTENSVSGVKNVGILNVSDVGFSYTEKNDEKMSLKKEWRIDSRYDEERPEFIKVIVQGKTENGDVLVEKEVTLDVYKDWKTELNNLPSTKGGKPIVYSVSNEYFTYRGINYRFDGSNYYVLEDDGETLINDPPYKSAIVNSNKKISGEYQTVVINAPTNPTLQVTKVSAEDTSLRIPNAEFTLYRVIRNSDGSETYEQVAGPLTTDEDGLCLFSGENITEGEYMIETRVPDGYFAEPDEKIQIFKDYRYPENIIIDEANKGESVFTENQLKTVYNKPIKSLQIKKTYLMNNQPVQTKGLLSETISFNVTPYGNNKGPQFNADDCKILIGTGVDETRVPLPDFSTYPVGNYWYEVTETEGKTAGVDYDKNKYYLLVSVVKKANAAVNSVGQIELHAYPPNIDGSYLNNDRVGGFENNLFCGSLQIEKTLSGNMADVNKEFEIQVILTAADGKTINNSITCEKEPLSVKKDGNNKIILAFALKRNEILTLSNIPAGINYDVIEKDYSNEGYSVPTYTISADTKEDDDRVIQSSSKWSDSFVEGKISADVDSISIKNEKNVPTDTEDTTITDTAKFTFTKHYILDGDTINGKSPAETFTVKAEPYSFANVSASAGITNANKATKMPAIPSISLSFAEGAAGDSKKMNMTVSVTLPKYTFVGDYWYKLDETNGGVQGVAYDSKSCYLHVQVLNNDDLSGLIRIAALHNSAPNSDGTPSDVIKKDGITNKYSSGSLSVTKQVTGNMGDKYQTYTATVEFESKLPVKSKITYNDGTTKTLDWSTEKVNGVYVAEAELELSKDDIATFTNIPYGVTYTVSETDYSGEGYRHSFTNDSNVTNEPSDKVIAEGTSGSATEKWNVAKATGTISDKSDEVTIINEKNTDIDVGVSLDNTQYIALLGLAVTGLAVTFVTRRKKEIQE